MQGALNPVTDFADYTPTITGFGTVTLNSASWKQVGDNIFIQVRFVTGTPTAVEAQITLPNSYTVKSSDTNYFRVGGLRREGSNNTYDMVATQDDGFLNIVGSSGTGALNGSSISGSADILTFTATVPVNELSSGLDVLVSNTQNTSATKNEFAIRVASNGTVEEDKFDIINGNCTISDSSLYACTFNAGIFTAEPVIVSSVCAVGTSSGQDANASANNITTTDFDVRVRDLNNNNDARDFCLTITKATADYKDSVINVANIAREYYSESEIAWGTWNGDTLYRRCFTVASDITVTSTVITTWDTSLKPKNVINYSGNDWALLDVGEIGSNRALITYDSSDGNLTAFLVGYKIGAESSYCMEYTK